MRGEPVAERSTMIERSDVTLRLDDEGGESLRLAAS
jgi:hypothetical protein